MAIIMILSISAVAMADTVDNHALTVQEGIPAEVYQEFIDDTPEGMYLSDVVRTVVDENVTVIRALYLPLIQPRGTSEYGQEYANYYYGNIRAFRYLLAGYFDVTYTAGSQPECTSFAYQKVNHYSNPSGYTFEITDERTVKGWGSASLTVSFIPYGTETSVIHHLVCDSEGVISIV